MAAEDEVKPEVADEDADLRGREDRDTVQRDAPRPRFPQKTGDEKWEQGLEYKLKPLLEEVDLAEYGGRDLLE